MTEILRPVPSNETKTRELAEKRHLLTNGLVNRLVWLGITKKEYSFQYRARTQETTITFKEGVDRRKLIAFKATLMFVWSKHKYQYSKDELTYRITIQ